MMLADDVALVVTALAEAGVAAWLDGGYPAAGFAGRGEIAGRPFACLTAEVQLLCHVGYEPDATDRHDVRLLARRFGLPLPHPYR